MRLPYFIGKVKNSGEYAISNFVPLTRLPISVEVRKTSIKAGCSIVKTNKKISVNPVKAYSVYDRVFVFSADGNLYELLADGYTFVSGNFASPPEVLPVIHKGYNAVAIIHKTDLIFLGKDMSVYKIRESKNHVFFKDRLFSASGSKIYFTASSLEDVNLNGSDYTCSGEIDAGDRVIDLVPYKKYILVVCAHSLKKLLPEYETDSFSLEDCGVALSGVKEKTVLSFENETMFLNGDTLVAYYGDVAKLGNILEEKDFTVEGEAVRVKDFYLLPIKIDEEKYFYAYKPIEKKEYLIPANNSIPCKNGDFFNCITNDIGKLEKAGECEWVSEKTGLGVLGKKVLNKICFYSDGQGELQVTGDNKTIKRCFEPGFNEIDICLKAKSYELKIKGKSDGVLVKNLKASFRY